MRRVGYPQKYLSVPFRYIYTCLYLFVLSTHMLEHASDGRCRLHSSEDAVLAMPLAAVAAFRPRRYIHTSTLQRPLPDRAFPRCSDSTRPAVRLIHARRHRSDFPRSRVVLQIHHWLQHRGVLAAPHFGYWWPCGLTSLSNQPSSRICFVVLAAAIKSDDYLLILSTHVHS
ncbi:hypothetical protein FN846DRAFT_191226 [Sphaerosporella brunnea]|uniref:Uncharacterized protein n=1 Tax=Sphaerosporella brunnea TaxID=1250544 RepID=A0A5J5EQ06_9PEZI|nr:hypothetical protein FN846DRAFT_191226 [Sphaerosporella brunnea]